MVNCIMYKCIMYECKMYKSIMYKCIKDNCKMNKCTMYKCIKDKCIIYKCMMFKGTKCKCTNVTLQNSKYLHVYLQTCKVTNPEFASVSGTVYIDWAGTIQGLHYLNILLSILNIPRAIVFRPFIEEKIHQRALKTNS